MMSFMDFLIKILYLVYCIILIRKGIGHIAAKATEAFSMTLKIGQDIL